VDPGTNKFRSGIAFLSASVLHNSKDISEIVCSVCTVIVDAILTLVYLYSTHRHGVLIIVLVFCAGFTVKK